MIWYRAPGPDGPLLTTAHVGHAIDAPRQLPDEDRDAAHQALRERCPAITPASATAYLPILSGEAPAGVVAIQGIAPHDWQPEGRAILTEIGGLLGLTLDKARQRQELTTLRTTMLQLSTSLDLQHTLDAVLVGILSLVPCTLASIYLDSLSPAGLMRVAARSVDDTPILPSHLPRPLDGSITGWVYRHRQSLIVPDLRADPRTFTGPDGPPPGLSSIVVPLLVGDRAVGTFIASRLGDTFTQRDLEVAESFAPLAAQAVTNARLFAETARAQTQAATLLEDIGDAIIRTNREGIIVSWNKGAELLYGYTAAEVVGLQIPAVPPEERAALRTMVQRVFAGDRVVNMETVRRHKDGHTLHVLTTLSPWREGGAITGILAIVKDITRLKALERALTAQIAASQRRERDKAYGAAVAQACNSAADGAAILQALVERTAEWSDIAGVYTFDDGQTELAGFASRPPPADATIYAIMQENVRTGNLNLLNPTRIAHGGPLIVPLAGIERVPLVAALVARDYHTLIFVPIHAAGEIVGLLAAAARAETPPFDPQSLATLALVAEQAGLAITKDRLLRRVEAQVHELEEANRHKDDFLASLSHELRTPLNAILGFGELIEDGFITDPDELHEVARDIVGSGRLLLDQVNGLLDMARVGSGRMEIAREIVAIPAIVEICERVIAPLVAAKKQRLIITLAPGLPPVMADSARLQQVLLNLLTNAA